MLRLAPCSAVLLLAACATAPAPSLETRPPPSAPTGGMERLLGQPAEAAIKLLGETSLDRREGAARHLQFAGACVLDLFYLPRAGTVPVATHAEARLPNGQDVQPGECLAALLRARPRG
jgi:hypothetical protein